MSTSQPPPTRYDTLRPLLQVVLQRFRAGGRSTTDFVRYSLQRYGPPIRPHLHQFLADTLTANGLDPATAADRYTPGASPAAPPTAEQRQAMIAEAAYLIAEQNGFQGDSTAFWQQAEQQVDQRLADSGVAIPTNPIQPRRP